MDIISLADKVEELQGVFIQFTGNEIYYTSRLEFAENTLNMAGNFRTVREDGTYKFSRRALVINGEFHIKKIYVGVDAYRESCIKEFSRVTESRELSILMEREMVLGEIDIRNLEVLGAGRFKVLGNFDLFEIVERYYTCQLLLKYLNTRNGVLSRIKKQIGSREYSKILGKREIKAVKASSSGDRLEIMARKMEKIVNREGVSPYDYIEIKYSLEGSDIKKWNYESILDNHMYCRNRLPKEVEQTVDYVEGVLKSYDIKESLIEVHSEYINVLKEFDELKRELWIHRVSMVKSSDSGKVHQHNKEYFEPYTKTGRNGVYRSLDVRGLLVELTNVAM